MPSADFCRPVRSSLDSLSRVVTTRPQISWGNSSRLRRAIAGSTLPVLDGYGLGRARPAGPTLAPHIRFLFIDSRFCYTLPSDPALRPTPLRFANPSPPSGWVEDFHFLAAGHAQRTVPRRDFLDAFLGTVIDIQTSVETRLDTARTSACATVCRRILERPGRFRSLRFFCWPVSPQPPSASSILQRRRA